MLETTHPPEKLTNLNRSAISKAIEKICKEMDEAKVPCDIYESVELLSESGERIPMNLNLKIASYENPFLDISLNDGEGNLVARKINAFGIDKSSNAPKIVATGRIDTYMHPGLGIGSGLLQSSESVIKKVILLSSLPKDIPVVLRLHDATNNSFHAKRGWSGDWAIRLGYKPVIDEENYFEKVLV